MEYLYRMKNTKLSLLTLLLLTFIFSSCLSSLFSINMPSENEKELLMAVMRGQAQEVKSLLDNGASPNAADSYNLSALMRCAKSGRLDIAELLVSYGADVNKVDDYDCTALFYANKPNVQKWLIDKGTNINICSSFHGDASAFEIYCRNAEILTVAKKNQIMNTMRSQGLTIPRAYMEKNYWINQLEIRQSINVFKNAGYDFNSTKTDVKYYPLSIAAQANNYILMQELVLAGANPRNKTKNGELPLNTIAGIPYGAQVMQQSNYGFITVVNSLLAYGADINGLDKDGNTPLCIAATVNNPGRVNALLTMKNCKVDGPGQYGESALFKTKNFAIVKTLIAYGANVNFQSTWGYTPLFTQSNVYIVQYLINKGADVNHINKDGENILVRDMFKAYDSFKRTSHGAATIENNYIGKVKILLNSGINVNYRVNSSTRLNETTALEWAKKVPFNGIIGLLTAYGAK